MLYHMLTGEPPLSENRERSSRISPQRFREVIPITNHQPGLPHRVVVLCHRLMELDPERRPQTPGLALREIDSVIEAIEAGQTQQYDASLVEQHSQAYMQMTQKQTEGEGKTVMLVESNVKVQDALREKLKELGYRVLILRDPKRAITRFEDLDPSDEQPADCVIFGSKGLGSTGIEAFAYFSKSQTTSYVPSILLTSRDYKKLVPQLELDDHHVVLELPLKFKNVRAVLNQLLSNETAS